MTTLQAVPEDEELPELPRPARLSGLGRRRGSTDLFADLAQLQQQQQTTGQAGTLPGPKRSESGHSSAERVEEEGDLPITDSGIESDKGQGGALSTAASNMTTNAATTPQDQP